MYQIAIESQDKFWFMLNTALLNRPDNPGIQVIIPIMLHGQWICRWMGMKYFAYTLIFISIIIL